jgi:hypothetical protein
MPNSITVSPIYCIRIDWAVKIFWTDQFAITNSSYRMSSGYCNDSKQLETEKFRDHVHQS